MASYAAPSGNNYELSSISAKMRDQGLSELLAVNNQYKDNAAVGAQVVGARIDSARTAQETSAAIQYNDAFLGSLARYQQGVDTTKAGLQSQMMAVEGGITKELQQQRGDIERTNFEAGARVTGNETRQTQEQGLRIGGEETRKNQDNQGDNVLRLRADARNAIERTGQRFFG